MVMNSPRLPIVVLVSGRGSNLQALIDAQLKGALPIEIRAVLSDQPQAVALERARQANIPAILVDRKNYPTRAAFDRALFSRISKFQPEVIVLAGFMRVLGCEVVSSWAGRMINIHPSLLPKYPGLHTHQRALDAPDLEHGASIHYVTSELDGGPVIAQVKIPIKVDDTAEKLAQRLLPLEHELLCGSLKLIAEKRLSLDKNVQVLLDGKALDRPLEMVNGGLLPAA